MKNKFLYIILIFILFIGVTTVDAKVINLGVDCNGLFTREGVDLIRKYLNYFRIAGPIILIIMVAFDLTKAVIVGDDQMMKKVQKSVLNRFIACVLLFLVPTIVRILLGLEGVREKIEIPDDPICHALKENNKVAIY